MQDISQLPDMLRPGSPEFQNAEKILLEETKNFERQVKHFGQSGFCHRPFMDIFLLLTKNLF